MRVIKALKEKQSKNITFLEYYRERLSFEKPKVHSIENKRFSSQFGVLKSQLSGHHVME